MRKLFAEDCHGGANALEYRCCERGTNGQTINEVVQAITQGDHPGQRANVGVGSPFQPIATTATIARPPSTVWALGVLVGKECMSLLH